MVDKCIQFALFNHVYQLIRPVTQFITLFLSLLLFSFNLLKNWHLPLEFINRNGAASRQTQGSSVRNLLLCTSINRYLEYDCCIWINAWVFRGGLIIRCVCQDSSTTIKSHFASGVRIVAISDKYATIDFLALEVGQWTVWIT